MKRKQLAAWVCGAVLIGAGVPPGVSEVRAATASRSAADAPAKRAAKQPSRAASRGGEQASPRKSTHARGGARPAARQPATRVAAAKPSGRGAAKSASRAKSAPSARPSARPSAKPSYAARSGPPRSAVPALAQPLPAAKSLASGGSVVAPLATLRSGGPGTSLKLVQPLASTQGWRPVSIATGLDGHAGSGAVAPIGPASRGAAVATLASAAPSASAVGSAADSAAAVAPIAPAAAGHVSIGEAIGLHRIPDPLALRSGVALVVDPANGEILYEKNSRAVLPIASITKLMTAMVVLDARQPLDERLTIDERDRDLERGSASRLPMGSNLTRAELLQLALMSSENRAASALARHYPGGLPAFVDAANRKAVSIGMRDSVFADGTGLSSSNVSTARDLVMLVAYAARYAQIRDYSTAAQLQVRTAGGPRVFRTTNRMVASPTWDLDLQKTGYINEAGNCLVMKGHVDGRDLIMVLLDSQGRYSRLGDAMRLRKYLEG